MGSASLNHPANGNGKTGSGHVVNAEGGLNEGKSLIQGQSQLSFISCPFRSRCKMIQTDQLAYHGNRFYTADEKHNEYIRTLFIKARDGIHDDLVLSVALACWAAERVFDLTEWDFY
jgi:hypothetical protein